MRMLQVLPALEVGGAELVAAWLATQVQSDEPAMTTVLALAGGPLAAQLSAMGIRHQVARPSWRGRMAKWLSPRAWRGQLSRRFGGAQPDLSRDQRTLFRHRMAQDASTLTGLIQREGLQAIHFHFISTLHLAAVAKRQGCRVVYTHHNTLSHRHSPADIAFFKSVWQHIDQVICVSQSSADDLIRSCGMPAQSVQVIHNPTLSSPMEVNEPPHHADFVIGTASNLGAVKRIDVLLDATRVLLASTDALPPWRVAIAGGNTSTVAKWRAWAAAAEVSSRTSFLGSLARAQMPGYYRSLDCLVICSESEASPLQGIEAMSFGLPVVCSDIPALRDTFGPTASYFQMGNAPALASALSGLLRDRDAGAELGRSARSRWERLYHPQLIREQYFAVYRGHT